MVEKTVFISGATSGIGLVTANKLHDMGWKVYAGGLQGDNFLKLTHGITQLPFDITDPEGVEGAVKLLNIEIDHLDALINNAGIQIPGPIEALSMEDIRWQFDVNFFGHLQVSKSLLPLLRKADSGRIINVSSLMGQVAFPLLGAYSMSKHALEAMSDVLRMELQSSGIHVTVIEPGAIKTPMTISVAEKLDAIHENSSAEIQSNYANLFDGMIKTLHSQSQNATSPEKVANTIIHALASKKPKARYTIGMDVSAFSTIRKILPDSFGDWFIYRVLGIK